MDLTETAAMLVTRWGWLLGLVVLFAAVYRFGTGRSAGAPAGYGCLVSVVVTLLFFVVVVF